MTRRIVYNPYLYLDECVETIAKMAAMAVAGRLPMVKLDGFCECIRDAAQQFGAKTILEVLPSFWNDNFDSPDGWKQYVSCVLAGDYLDP